MFERILYEAMKNRGMLVSHNDARDVLNKYVNLIGSYISFVLLSMIASAALIISEYYWPLILIAVLMVVLSFLVTLVSVAVKR
jgi:hypothetical protein